VSKLIRRPPLIGTGQLTFLQWQARADSSKARQELGVEFRDWREGISQTVRWMREAGRV
jgi:nucleoside-diphosphate-sugar epimerase